MAYTVKATQRTDTGKGKVGRLRRSGSLPAVMYGHGEPSLMLAMSTHEFDRLLDRIRGHSPIVEVEIDGQQPQKCVIKTLQRNPVTGGLLHVDFQKVHAGEKITMNVPVLVSGAAEGVKQGGMLDHVLRTVPVRATIDAIPEHFQIDVTNLKIDHSIHIKDLNRPDLEYTLPLDSPIVTVLSPRKLTEAPSAAEAAAAAEAGPAEPEVITEKKPTEEETAGEEEKGKGKAKGEKKEEKKEEKKKEKK
ncbi:50S ribosomal protein L25 [candidate division WOR-3 bacterium]|uniref:Large ribosomal subunit protein bL25 n=1 Tax=candidate division WOR-3 bacterium TaxID=2052148 RepID=A0A937XEF7_UNCW3|nr:50S ribosomal protein L25 [candidate division WOR-3 bacterium]